MNAMVLERQQSPLMMRGVARPAPGPDQVLIRVLACGVCRTDLHIVDGDLTDPKLPLILGHQIVGRIEAFGDRADKRPTNLSEHGSGEHGSGSDLAAGLHVGDRVGVPWLGGVCGDCFYCNNGSENLCDDAVFTGYQVDGGFAEYAVADTRFCFPVPSTYSDVEAAPLLCAGLIGYRSLRMAEPVLTGIGRKARLGLYGFGAAAHIVAQIAIHRDIDVFAFVSPGDRAAADFAVSFGAAWAGPSTDQAPVELDAAIIFAPVGSLIPASLRSVRKGGRVVCAGIHMSDIPAFPYHLLWGERMICSVANLTRRDGVEFFDVAPKVPVETTVTEFALEDANDALEKLRSGDLDGAAVLRIPE